MAEHHGAIGTMPQTGGIDGSKGRRKIGIFGGSFNPVHIAHIALADYLCRTGGLDEVWLTLSPLNPIKKNPEELADDGMRLSMLRIACAQSDKLEPCDIEMHLPKPSYTATTLHALADTYPECSFTLIIGSDNWAIFDRWRDRESIIADFGVIVYPRPGFPVNQDAMPKGVNVAATPLLDLSSTFIRDSISRGIDMSVFLPPGVYSFIKENKLYDCHG